MVSNILDEVPIHERIFCNRSLNLKSIKAIGFDMDYTLAVYKSETFERLAYEETLKKLVEKGYPKEILNWSFDSKRMIRGLVIDKKRGNILKMDRHRYVKVAYHGSRELSRDERRKLYDVENVSNYEEPDFALIDTIFSLAEAYLISQLVDFKGSCNKLDDKNFIDFYNDVRKCIDTCHRDGSIKNKVAKNPEYYIQKDNTLADILEDLKQDKRSLFIVTNSYWEYTNIVMNYLLTTPSKHWMDFFDIVITGSTKPSFFMAKNTLYEVILENSYLKNIEVLPNIKNHNKYTKIFQGGHVKNLHDILNIQKGSEILYVGDHIYGDILRSKKEIGWRTMLVIDELASEIKNIYQHKNEYIICQDVSKKREQYEDEYERLLVLQNALKTNRQDKYPEIENIKEDDLEKQIKKVIYDMLKTREYEKKLIRSYHTTFHPIWGEMMKTGMQNSRFSAQVETYACLYTGKLSNLRHYGSQKNFRAVTDSMPHDLYAPMI